MSAPLPVSNAVQSFRYGAAPGPIALVSFIGDGNDVFDLILNADDGVAIAREPENGVVTYYRTAADVPTTVPATVSQDGRPPSAPTYIVDVSKGGFARLEKDQGSARPKVETSSPDIIVQPFQEGVQFRGIADNAASEVNAGWPWWATALLIVLGALAIAFSIAAIVMAVITAKRERAEEKSILADEERLRIAEERLGTA